MLAAAGLPQVGQVSHLAPSTFVVPHAVDCSPIVNLRSEREFAILPVHIEMANLTSGHSNHDDDCGLWIIEGSCQENAR